MAPPRRTQQELLDQGVGTLADVRANLNDMWRLNRLTGGVSAITSHLLPRLNPSEHDYHIADIGTGSARFARYLSAWAARRQIRMRVYALDWSYRNLTIAQENIRAHPSVTLIQANGLALPFAPHAIDYFVASLLMHHFEPETLIDLIRHTFENARRGIIMSDITRGWLPQIGFRLIQPAAAPHPMTLHDGLISIQRAYTADELIDLARAAGVPTPRVFRHPLWRMTLVAEKSA